MTETAVLLVVNTLNEMIDERTVIINKLKETLSNVLLAYSKQRKEFNIPIKPEAVKVAEVLLKQLK